MRHVLTEAAHVILGLLAVALITEATAWSYPPGRSQIAWTGWIAAVGVLLWSIPAFVTAWRKDRGRD